MVSLPVLVVAVLLVFPPAAYYHMRTRYYPGEKLLFYKEGVAATVSVHEQRDAHLALVINGSKTAYANIEDLRVHKMLAYLPYVFKPEATSANVIGFGTGVTTSTLLDMLSFRDVRIADICPELLESAVIFSAYNRMVTGHPRFDFMVEDGRSYLLRTDRKYDVISSNAIHARLNANLYTRDFYELCLERITPGGIVCQWMPTNWLTNEEFRSLIRAFTDVFEDSQIWFGSRGHLLLVGSNQPLKVDYSIIDSLYRQPGVMMDLSSVDIFTPQLFASRLLLTGDALKDYVAGAPVNTDDLPFVEFSRETNMIPNIQVLFELAEAAENVTQHIVFSTSSDPEEEALIRGMIEFESQMIRDYLRRFAAAYGQ
jgi:spermidine synthase